MFENFFDRANDILEKRKDFHRRCDHPKYGKPFRKELKRIFNAKLKEKRLGGLRLKMKSYLAGFVLIVVVLFWALHNGHMITALVDFIILIVLGYDYISGVCTLCGPLKEADREASQIIEELVKADRARRTGRPAAPPQPQPQAPAAQPLTQNDLLAQAMAQAGQRTQP